VLAPVDTSSTHSPMMRNTASYKWCPRVAEVPACSTDLRGSYCTSDKLNYLENTYKRRAHVNLQKTSNKSCLYSLTMCDSFSIHVLLLSPSMISAIHEIIPGSQLEVV
jgi:hypothetical protein